MSKGKVHYGDIRLHNNAGINFPVCYAGAELLDMDKTILRTGGYEVVTCKHCLRIAPKRYPWARLVERAVRARELASLAR